MPIEALFARWRERVEAALESSLPAATAQPERLHAAMRHAVLGGGKRMRPLLVYASGHACGADEALLDAPAAAVELIHAYSLVHDDLPAMDDDSLRRGRPTVHVAFDEATAILAGDALQALAFALLARAPTPAAATVAMLQALADAAGTGGMCGGQALDLDATGQGHRLAAAHGPRGDDSGPELAALEQLHAMKTGALIEAAVELGARAAQADAATRAGLQGFARALGLAFQIRDDILDVEADSAQLGKTAGKDQAQGKTTFPALIGMAASRQRLDALAARMDEALADVPGDTGTLAALGRLAIRRDH